MNPRDVILRLALSSLAIVLAIAGLVVPAKYALVLFISVAVLGLALIVLSVRNLVRNRTATVGTPGEPAPEVGERAARGKHFARNQALIFACVLLVLALLMLFGGLALGGPFAVAGALSGGVLVVVITIGLIFGVRRRRRGRSRVTRSE